MEIVWSPSNKQNLNQRPKSSGINFQALKDVIKKQRSAKAHSTLNQGSISALDSFIVDGTK